MVGTAQFTRYWTKNTCANRLAGLVDQNGRIAVETDNAAVGTTDFLRCAYNHSLHHIAFLNTSTRDGFFHTDNNCVANRSSFPLGPTKNLDALHPACA